MLTATTHRNCASSVPFNKVSFEDLASSKFSHSIIKTARRPMPILVELGNIGLSWENERSSELLLCSAKRHPKWLHVGIDLAQPPSIKRNNLIQITADFLSGLHHLKDNTASMIVSRFSVGYYAESGKQIPLPTNYQINRKIPARICPKLKSEVLNYTARVIDLSLQKLRPNGVIYFQVCDTGLATLSEAAGRLNAIEDFVIQPLININQRPLVSYWAKELSPDSMIYNVKLKRS